MKEPHMDSWTLPSEMKFVEAIGAPLFHGNGWANTSLIHSDPYSNYSYYEVDRHIFGCSWELPWARAFKGCFSNMWYSGITLFLSLFLVWIFGQLVWVTRLNTFQSISCTQLIGKLVDWHQFSTNRTLGQMQKSMLQNKRINLLCHLDFSSLKIYTWNLLLKSTLPSVECHLQVCVSYIDLPSLTLRWTGFNRKGLSFFKNIFGIPE